MDRRRILALLLGLVLVRGLIYAAMVPPWQAPDEPYHFLSAQSPHIQRLPDAESNWQQLQTEITASMIQFRFWDMMVFAPSPDEGDDGYRHLLASPRAIPRLPTPRAFTYYLLSPLLRGVKHQDVTFQLYWARFFSIVVNMGVVAVAFGIAQLLFPGQPFGTLLLPLSIVFLPTHTGMMAAVYDGNIAELLISVAILFLVWGKVRGFHWYHIAAMVVFTVLGVAAKPTAFYFVPVLMLLLGIYAWRRMRGWWRLLIPPLAMAFVYTVTLTSSRFRGMMSIFLRNLLPTAESPLLAVPEGFTLQRRFFITFQTFWAAVGWHSLPISDAWTWVLLVVVLLAIIGLARFIWRNLRAGGGASRETVLWPVSLVFVACVGVDLGAMTVSFVTTGKYLSAGRYFFGAIIPIMTLLVIGWRELTPSNWRAEVLAFMVSFFFLFDTAVLLYYAVPFFYPLWS